MSNLYKQWFIRTEDKNTRVIDSNAIIGDYIEKNAARAPKIIGEAGFEDGIAAEDTGTVVKADEVENAVSLAREEAERMIEQARKQADAMLQEAREQTDHIREDAKNQGIQDGQTWMQQEIQNQREQLEEQHRDRMSSLEEEYEGKRNSMEQDLVDVILEVFNKVFHIQFDNKKHILMYLIDNAILNIEGEKNFHIKVAESNAQFLENQKEEILDRVGHDIELEIVADSTMDGNDCVIETDSGVFDCSLGTQLENLIKDIRSLCS